MLNFVDNSGAILASGDYWTLVDLASFESWSGRIATPKGTDVFRDGEQVDYISAN